MIKRSFHSSPSFFSYHRNVYSYLIIKMKALLVGLAIVVTCLTQSCKSPTNSSVDWFVVLNAPASLSEGYLYFDSNTQTSEFTKY